MISPTAHIIGELIAMALGRALWLAIFALAAFSTARLPQPHRYRGWIACALVGAWIIYLWVGSEAGAQLCETA